MLDKAAVDLSHWDEVDSFEDTKDDGVVGIIHKATESTNYFDPTYNQRKKDALAAGLLWGAYHFLRPSNMKEQAQYFVSEVGKDLDLYATDHEDEGVSLNDLKTFLREVKRLTGKSPIIYSGHVLKEQLGDRRDSGTVAVSTLAGAIHIRHAKLAKSDIPAMVALAIHRAW